MTQQCIIDTIKIQIQNQEFTKQKCHNKSEEALASVDKFTHTQNSKEQKRKAN